MKHNNNRIFGSILRWLALGTLCGVVAQVGGVAQAQLLSDESFGSYPVGTPVPDSTPSLAASGYIGNWQGDSASFGTQWPVVAAGPLRATDAGNHLHVPSDTTGGQVTADNSGRVYRLLDPNLQVDASTRGTVYLSFAYKNGMEADGVVYQMLDLYNGGTGDAQRTFTAGLTQNGGNSGNQYVFGVNEAYYSLNTAADAKTHVFVVKFDLYPGPGAQSVTVWLDPKPGVQEPAGGVVVGGQSIAFDRLAISDYFGNSCDWGEIRWGTTFDSVTANAVPSPPVSSAVISTDKEIDGVTLKFATGKLKLRVFSPRVVEVIYAPGDSFPTNQSLAVIHPPEFSTWWKLEEMPDEIRLRTDQLIVHVNRASGAVVFTDISGKTFLAERPGGRSLAPAHVGIIDTLRSRQAFELPADEAIFGLGQHPDNPINYRGTKVHLQQENRIVAVPVLVSSRGYGVFWDNPAVTDVDAGASDPTALAWTSEAADTLDYYFIAGPDLNQVIASYRELTGAAPMFPKWTWGFWQCREHYETQAELLGVVAEYRRRHIPLDGIIQDWQYWNKGGWGSHEFDTNRYPDATAMTRTVHNENAHIIISIWARFDLGLTNLAELEAAGAAYPPVYQNVYPAGQGKWYDPFNPKGQQLYWKFLSQRLFARGFDGWWMDASEAELGGHWGEMRDLMTAAGPGARTFNAYPLEHTAGVYQGQRAESSAKRAFILTRSAWAGQQRNAAVTWSGDTSGHWDIFRKQIPAGLNFVATGIPYWNTDIGGFFGGDPADSKYSELFTRWFQFGTFCPMFRVHGTGKSKEVWRFAPATQSILTNYIALRYHLLPYIYSVAWQVTSANDSMISPLVMDFRTDTNVFNIPNQFLFGHAFMACPVTKAADNNRSVYLPAGTAWYDFWTGQKLSGGQTLAAASPIETMPLFVRAGSIIPYGPAIEYAAQSCDPLELRIYRGTNGQFTLYEDEGDNYNYEHGAYATIPLTWNEANQTLTIDKRVGSFPGMLKERTFRIVFVAAGQGAGVTMAETPDAIIHYTGMALTVTAGK